MSIKHILAVLALLSTVLIGCGSSDSADKPAELAPDVPTKSAADVGGTGRAKSDEESR